MQNNSEAVIHDRRGSADPATPMAANPDSVLAPHAVGAIVGCVLALVAGVTPRNTVAWLAVGALVGHVSTSAVKWISTQQDPNLAVVVVSLGLVGAACTLYVFMVALVALLTTVAMVPMMMPMVMPMMFLHAIAEALTPSHGRARIES